MLKEQTHNQEIFIKEIHTLVDYFKELNHDYRHHLQYLYNIAEKHDKPETLKYAKNLLDESEKINLGFIENQIVISLLFMQKAEQAKKENISFECNVPNTLHTKVKEADLNVILSNLLDNAFEAASKVINNKKIKL